MGVCVSIDTTTWTIERCSQLAKLERLFECIRTANRGSSFIQTFQDAEAIVNALGDSTFPERSFVQFLNDIAIESRQQYKEKHGKTPE
jgi:predicted KAP-like P-loop ATPase